MLQASKCPSLLHNNTLLIPNAIAKNVNIKLNNIDAFPVSIMATLMYLIVWEWDVWSGWNEHLKYLIIYWPWHLFDLDIALTLTLLWYWFHTNIGWHRHCFHINIAMSLTLLLHCIDLDIAWTFTLLWNWVGLDIVLTLTLLFF